MTRGHPWFMLPNVVGLLLCDMVGPVGLHGACDPLHGAVMAARDMHAPLMPAACECVRQCGTPFRISLGRSVSATLDCPPTLLPRFATSSHHAPYTTPPAGSMQPPQTHGEAGNGAVEAGVGVAP